MQPTPVFLLGESPWTEEPDWLHPWDHKELDMSKHSTAHDIHYFFVFPGISVGKESTCTAEDPGLIPGLGRSPGEGICYPLQYSWASLVGSAGKESACNAGDLASIPGLGRSPGEGKGHPLQSSGLENSMDCVVHGVTELDTAERLSLSYIQ